MPVNWTSQLLNWSPFIALLVLILVWMFLSQRTGGGARSLLGRTVEIYEAQYTEMQRMNVLLERIAVALEKRAETSA